MKILVITSCFAPKNVIGAVRVSKIVKYLVRQNNDITVISPVLEKYDGCDMTLECEEFAHIKRITIPYAKITSRMTKSYRATNRVNNSILANRVSKNYKTILYRKARGVFAWWRDYEWSKKVINHLKIENEKYDWVISSYPNIAAHIAAKYAVKKAIAKRWLADFRDPIVIESSVNAASKRLLRLQTSFVSDANLVSIISRKEIDYFLCKDEDKMKIFVMPNGFDYDDFQYLKRQTDMKSINKERLVFSYAGGLYGGERDCSPLFYAIRQLIDEKKISADSICFNYAGKDERILLSQAEKYSVDDIIRIHGFIPRAESLKMQSDSDCVVVASFCYTDNGGAMTGKIYEPIMMNRYILLLVNGPGRNSEPGEFIRYLNAGTVYEESSQKGDVSEIKKMIMKMLFEKQTNGAISSNVSIERKNEYNYEKIVEKLVIKLEKN